MNICPITYAACEQRYSAAGLKRLSRRLTHLKDLPFTAPAMVQQAAARAPKMSIQGVQPKLSAVLNAKAGGFEPVDTGGQFILKPQNPQYRQLPENEDLSMRLAAAAGVRVPLHGLVYANDGSLAYFVKRFDRVGKHGKLAVEDFAQLLGLSRDTKYDASMEKVAQVIEHFCTFPAMEKVNLFRMTLVNYLVGNEDMHVKNFSLIIRDDLVELSPAYDIVNTTIVLAGETDEIALPVKGKKRKLDAAVLIDYFGSRRLGLAPKAMAAVVARIRQAIPQWHHLIDVSFLPVDLKNDFCRLVQARSARLFGKAELP